MLVREDADAFDIAPGGSHSGAVLYLDDGDEWFVYLVTTQTGSGVESGVLRFGPTPALIAPYNGFVLAGITGAAIALVWSSRSPWITGNQCVFGRHFRIYLDHTAVAATNWQGTYRVQVLRRDRP